MTPKNDYIEYATKELEINGLLHTDIGKQMIQLLETAWKFGNQNKVMVNNVIDMLDRVNNKLPLLPIEEDGMIPIPHANGPDQMRHSRYYPVYQDEDGKYYDDKAVAFISNDGSATYFYGNGEYNSTKEVEFPYYPQPRYVFISDENLNEQLSKTMDS
jgi:hypothetical protein